MILLLVTAMTLLAADAPGPGYVHQIENFRAQRQSEINSDDGWITLVGLHWLKAGENRVGSDPTLEVPLPASAPKRVGTITVEDHQARFEPAAGVPLKQTAMTPNKEILSIGSIRFFLIEREGKFAVRVKDKSAPARREFTGLRWYPIDRAWRVEAKFVPFAERHTITFDTIAGVKEEMESPGYVTFQKDGREFRLDPVWEGHRLFFVFRDQTSGKQTYGSARFLYAEAPENGGPVILDFNQAVNPPCVFTPYATCPLPPRQNRLIIGVEAGELMYGKDNHLYP